MAILISEKIGFKSQIITSAKEGHFTMIKDSVLLEDTPHTNMYGANKRATNTQNRRGKIQQFRDFNVPLLIINRKIREKHCNFPFSENSMSFLSALHNIAIP